MFILSVHLFLSAHLIYAMFICLLFRHHHRRRSRHHHCDCITTSFWVLHCVLLGKYSYVIRLICFFARWFCACHIWSNVWSWRCLFVCPLATFFHTYSIFFFSGLSTNVITVKRDEFWMRHFIRNTTWANGK